MQTCENSLSREKREEITLAILNFCQEKALAVSLLKDLVELSTETGIPVSELQAFATSQTNA